MSPTGEPAATTVAVVLPCYNEAATIGKVVDDFARELPKARIVVIDNNSSDETGRIAREHGAEVFFEPRQGKGFAIQTICERVEADVYLMADGDDTYDAASARKMIQPILDERADMVVGSRLQTYDKGKSFRPLHVGGNKLVRWLVNRVTGRQLTDILSGYRAFNRKVARSLPILSPGFEVETEMTILMCDLGFHLVEVETPYGVRPEGSESKLSTFRDGFRVLWKVFTLLRVLKPLTFFGLLSLICFVLSVVVGSAPIHDYLTDPNHYVSHVPSAMLAAALMLLAFGLASTGVILHTLNWKFREVHNVLMRR